MHVQSFHSWLSRGLSALLFVGLSASPGLSQPCGKCLNGAASCTEACRKAGFGPDGACAYPESTDPKHCCECSLWKNCKGCLNGHASCDEACKAAYPDKPYGACKLDRANGTDPTNCCECSSGWIVAPDFGCGTCLGKFANCDQACAASYPDRPFGECKDNGSDDPTNCCRCTHVRVPPG
jgi:hypothetical protein